MTISIVPVNDDAGVYGMPNAFWPALCVETPIKHMLGCEYTKNGMAVKYEHDGYVGELFTEAEALEMHRILTEFVKTDEYLNHRYFSEIWNGKPFRRNQMEHMLEFLPVCGGFRMEH